MSVNPGIVYILGSRRPEVFCNFIEKEALVQVFSCEFCEISKNTFSYRTPPVAASVFWEGIIHFPLGKTLHVASATIFISFLQYLSSLPWFM